ncbi:MAG: response regulator [Bacteroidales bacterium]|nr:response regulator [Bacteroidales bacterium]
MFTKESHKILIVDDLVDNLKLMVSIFEKYQPYYELFQTSNSVNALEIAIKTMPDLIITDWKMPEMDGIELIKQLKDETITSNIPILIVTGVMHSSNDLHTALEEGAVDFVRKPLDPIELIARVNSAINTSKNYKKRIEAKNRELAENALFLVKNREFIAELTKKIKFLKDHLKGEENQVEDIMNELINLVNSKTSDDSLQRFNIAFYSVHEYFNKNLIAKYSNLTNNDLKLCAFLRLGMSTKDIASILYQTNDSVKVSRSRLRKKLGLEQSQNLQVFLSSF